MQAIQDMPAIVNESYIERIVEQQIYEEQFPTFLNRGTIEQQISEEQFPPIDVYENNKFRTKFKIIEYMPEKKNSKKTVFSGLLKNYPDGKVKIPCDILKEDCEYNLRIISPLGNTTYNIPQDTVPEKITESPKKNQTLTFSVFNDNLASNLERIITGDDMGYTHGVKIRYGVDFEKNHLNIEYLTNLYARRRMDLLPKTAADGQVFIPQNFVDEISFIATLDNKKQNKFLYEAYSFGFLSLDNFDDDLFFTASAQQKLFHKILSNFVPTFFPDNHEDTSAFKLGGIFGFHKGLYLPIRFTNWLNLFTDLKIGARLCTIPNASYVDLGVSTDLTFKKEEKPFILNFNTSCDMKVHEGGLMTTLSFGASIGLENWQLGINFLKPFGDAFVMYKYDDEREDGYDIIREAFLKFGF